MTESPEARPSTTPAGGDGTPWAEMEINLPQFEGPLELLLHLVRSQGLDILDIPISRVARQYNEYLDQRLRLDLDVAAEYLVVASTLAHIKSRMMLPQDPRDEDDPRHELVDQLLEHEKYLKAAEALGEIDSSRDLVFVREGSPPKELAGEVTLKVDLADLVRAFERVLGRLEADELNQVIRREDFKVQDMMERIISRLELEEELSFSRLIESCRTRLERVVLFLALLELVRLGSVAARQTSWRDDIQVERHPLAEQEGP